MANQTLKNVIGLYDKAVEQLNNDFTYASRVEVDTIPGGQLQNANNIYWRNVEQQAPVISGFDLTGEETTIIEQGYPLRLQDPRNDFFQLRVDELRDARAMEKRGMAGAKRLNADMNKRIADLVAATGTMYYETGTTDFDFVAEADTLMTERQAYRDNGASFFLSPRANQKMAGSLASRTLFPDNRSERAYSTALIGENVAGFDVFRAPTSGTIAARANATTTTVAANVTEVPEGFVSAGIDSIQNVDYRVGAVQLTAGTNYNVGDVITFAGVNALGMADKTNTNQLMTFRIVGKDTNTITVYPKPIAANQAGITPAQAAYANISTAIVSGMVVSKVNVAGGQANSFWANDSICVVNGDAPLEMLDEFNGMKVVSETLDNGVKLYMAYDANLATLNARVRLFTWYGLVNKDPSRNGNAIYVPA